MNLKEQEIQEGNKFIAEFMGGISFTDTPNSELRFRFNRKSYAISLLQYHSSWDWLIPVIKKCKDINKLGYKGSYIIKNLLSLEIENCWLAVVQFIKWYNQNKK